MYDILEILRYTLIPNAVTYMLLSAFIVTIVLMLLSRKFSHRWLCAITFAVELVAEVISVIFIMRSYAADDLVHFSASLGGVISFTILISITIILLLRTPLTSGKAT